MVRATSAEDREHAIDLWFQGYSYRQIQHKMGIAISTIATIIGEERERAHDIVELRSLNLALGKAKARLPDALRGANFLSRLNDLDISVGDLEGSMGLLRHYGDDASEVLKAASRLRSLEASRGMTYDQIVADAVAKDRQFRVAERGIEELGVKERTIRASLPELDGLKALNAKLKANNITLDQLGSIIERGIRIEALGFSPAAADLLASELSKSGLTPKAASARVIELLSSGGDLKGAVEKLSAEEHVLKNDLNAKRTELDGLRKQTDAMSSHLVALKGQADERVSLIKNLEKIKLEKEKQIQEEFDTKRSRIEDETSELERKRDAIADEGKAYASKLQEAKEQGKAYAEELKLAQVILIIKADPSALASKVGLDYNVFLMEGIVNYVRVRGINPKLAFSYITDPNFTIGAQRPIAFPSTEVYLQDFLQWSLNALRVAHSQDAS